LVLQTLRAYVVISGVGREVDEATTRSGLDVCGNEADTEAGVPNALPAGGLVVGVCPV